MKQRTAPATRSTRIRRASSERREKQKRDLRRSILQAATKEFLEHGYEYFSLRRVAERDGYTPTTIYLYFANKDDLLLATVQDGFAEFDRAMTQAAEKTTDPLARIEALGRTYIEFGLNNPALYRLMFMQRSDFYLMPRLIGSASTPEATPDDVKPQQRVVAQDLLVSAVNEAIAKKQIEDGNSLLIADALWSSVHGLVALATSPLMDGEHAQKVTTHLLAILVSGLKRNL
jgi:AcrR family transcriptional regulator